MLIKLLTIVHIICAISIIALVLVQRGRGADAGAGFGSGASGTVFGARGARTALSRMTAILAAIFMVTSLSLAYVGTRKAAAPTSVLDTLAVPASETPAAPAAADTAVPANVPPATAPAATAPATPAPAGK